MNILFISDYLKSGGKERRLTELITELVARGKVTPIVMLLEGIDANTSIDYKAVLDLGVRIHYLGNYNRWQLPLQIFKICKKEKIHIINTWAPAVYTYLIYPSKFFLRIPIINNAITSARNDISSFGMFKIRGTYILSNKILSNSYQALEVFKVPNKKRLVIYNGFRQDRIANLVAKHIIKKRININSKYIIAMAAEYSNRKDYPTYIKAANIVSSKEYDVTFLCMGSGDYKQYQHLVAIKSVDKIKFLERQIDVESIMNVCDIGVLASLVEGVPNSILEFMALGKPVIANSGISVGTNELIEDGINGFLIPPKNSDLLANHIIDLLNNSEKCIQFGDRGKLIVQNKFNLKKMVDSFENLFSEYSPNSSNQL